ncbi:hypothetical protein U0070_002691, partial [Myodes glareolus]
YCSPGISCSYSSPGRAPVQLGIAGWQLGGSPRVTLAEEFQEPLVLQSARSFCHCPFSDILFVLVPLPRRLPQQTSSDHACILH